MALSVSDTAELVSQSHSIIYDQSEVGADNNEAQNEITLESIHSLLTQMNSKLTNIEIKNNSLETRLTEIERKIVSINEIQGALDTLNSKVSVIDNGLNTATKEFKDLESNVSALGNVFDSIREVSENNKSLASSNKKEILKAVMGQRRLEEKVENELKAVNEVSDNVKESLTDLKARSMRDNLIFSGFPEERWEDTEAILQSFLQKKYKLDYEIPFERVHRMGKWSEFRERPRNIVAKFTYFKDREFIRKNAARMLKGSRVWVNEQFPPEIEEKRKQLYPVLRQAKKDKKRANLIRDTLYIEGEKYSPHSGSAPKTRPNRDAPNEQTQQSGTANSQPQKRPRQGSTPERR
jgi:hypothetical protein